MREIRPLELLAPWVAIMEVIKGEIKMTKKETVTFEYEHCGECPHAEDRMDGNYLCYVCTRRKRNKSIKDLWGEIPNWCHLENSNDR